MKKTNIFAQINKATIEIKQWNCLDSDNCGYSERIVNTSSHRFCPKCGKIMNIGRTIYGVVNYIEIDRKIFE